MNFFQQLIKFEKEVHGCNTVQMKEYAVDGGKLVKVPDLYRTYFPTLFEAEMKNQLRILASKAAKSSEAKFMGKIKQPGPLSTRAKPQNLKVRFVMIGSNKSKQIINDFPLSRMHMKKLTSFEAHILRLN